MMTCVYLDGEIDNVFARKRENKPSSISAFWENTSFQITVVNGKRRAHRADFHSWRRNSAQQSRVWIQRHLRPRNRLFRHFQIVISISTIVLKLKNQRWTWKASETCSVWSSATTVAMCASSRASACARKCFTRLRDRAARFFAAARTGRFRIRTKSRKTRPRRNGRALVRRGRSWSLHLASVRKMRSKTDIWSFTRPGV